MVVEQYSKGLRGMQPFISTLMDGQHVIRCKEVTKLLMSYTFQHFRQYREQRNWPVIFGHFMVILFKVGNQFCKFPDSLLLRSTKLWRFVAEFLHHLVLPNIEAKGYLSCFCDTR